MKLPTPRWDLSTVLYLKVDGEAAGMLIGYIVRPSSLTYLVSWAEDGECEHWEMELTEEKPL